MGPTYEIGLKYENNIIKMKSEVFPGNLRFLFLNNEYC